MTAAQLHVFDDAAALAAGACEAVIERLAQALKSQNRASIALAGGSTPRRLYELLAAPAAAERVDWPRVHVFWGDERCVAPDDPASNYAMARHALLDQLDLSAENVHRMAGELDPEAAANTYAAELADFFNTAPHQLPRFDLILLGMGTDGHTASLFPGSTALDERQRPVVPVPAVPNRLTLTFPVLNAAHTVFFLVSGHSKAQTLAHVLARTASYPAQHIQPISGHLHFFIDRPAATHLG